MTGDEIFFGAAAVGIFCGAAIGMRGAFKHPEEDAPFGALLVVFGALLGGTLSMTILVIELFIFKPANHP